MGIVGSKDEAGKVILGNLPPGFMDKKVQPDCSADTLQASLRKPSPAFTL
jgi:hypothetical protein